MKEVRLPTSDADVVSDVIRGLDSIGNIEDVTIRWTDASKEEQNDELFPDAWDISEGYPSPITSIKNVEHTNLDTLEFTDTEGRTSNLTTDTNQYEALGMLYDHGGFLSEEKVFRGSDLSKLETKNALKELRKKNFVDLQDNKGWNPKEKWTTTDFGHAAYAFLNFDDWE